MRARVKLQGQQALLKELKRLRKAHPEAVNAAMYKEGLATGGMSVKIVPVNKGRLRNTLGVIPPHQVGNRTQVIVGYGTNYALIVHERLDLEHKAPTRAKYLEYPYNVRRKGYFQRLARQTRDYVKKGIKVSSIPTSLPTKIGDE